MADTMLLFASGRSQSIADQRRLMRRITVADGGGSFPGQRVPGGENGMAQLGLAVRARCRVVVDNDWSGDPDGLVALAHHLLSPANRVVAVTSSFLNPRFPTSHSRAADGAAVAAELLARLALPDPPPVHAGAEQPVDAGAAGSDRSDASNAIVAEARRADRLPLYVACGGPLTNVAAAIRVAPDIVRRMTVLWVGGSRAPDQFEYNLDTDPAAAERVLGHPKLTVHRFPLETYRRCAYSVAELEVDLQGCGPLGAWLWRRFARPVPDWVELGEVWPMGDSPPVLVTALSDESSRWETGATSGGAERRVYTDVDFRLLVADMLAKFRRHGR
jgi:purine nucleosidase